MKAILNNEVIELNALTEAQLAAVPEAQRTQVDGVWYFNPDGAEIAANAPVKPSPWHVWQSGQWLPDNAKRPELLQLAAKQIDQQTAEQLAAGVEFNGARFPLCGELYAQNMAAASAYVIRGQTAGRNLYTLTGSYILVTDIAGLVAAGDDQATSICMSGAEAKDRLTTKTTEELIAFIFPAV